MFYTFTPLLYELSVDFSLLEWGINRRFHGNSVLKCCIHLKAWSDEFCNFTFCLKMRSGMTLWLWWCWILDPSLISDMRDSVCVCGQLVVGDFDSVCILKNYNLYIYDRGTFRNGFWRCVHSTTWDLICWGSVEVGQKRVEKIHAEGWQLSIILTYFFKKIVSRKNVPQGRWLLILRLFSGI